MLRTIFAALSASDLPAIAGFYSQLADARSGESRNRSHLRAGPTPTATQARSPHGDHHRRPQGSASYDTPNCRGGTRSFGGVRVEPSDQQVGSCDEDVAMLAAKDGGVDARERRCHSMQRHIAISVPKRLST